MFSPVERREGLELRTFGEIMTGLITGANNSSGGALLITVGKWVTSLSIACRSGRWVQGTLSFLNPCFMSKIWSSMTGSCYRYWSWQISTSLCVDNQSEKSLRDGSSKNFSRTYLFQSGRTGVGSLFNAWMRFVAEWMSKLLKGIN